MASANNASIGATIKALRKMRGLTQAQLADMVALERTSIANIEAGRQMLSTKTVNAIAQALGYEVRVHFALRDRPENFA